MSSGKEKLGCTLSTLSPDELRGEEMHQENQTVPPFSSSLVSVTKNRVFLETVSVCER